LAGPPVATAGFLRTNWETQPLAIDRDSPRYFAALPGLDAVDELITATACGSSRSGDDGRLVRAEQDGTLSQRSFRLGPRGFPDIQDVYRAYDDGYSVVLNRLHFRSSSVATLCRKLEAELHHPVGANLYLTPRNGQGFLPHMDTHDVFILQLHGTKEWHVASPVRELPLATDPQPANISMAEHQKYLLEPGDVLYLPRGFPHEAATSASSSLHLTVGIHVYRWLDLLTDCLRLLADKETPLRTALVPGFLDRPVDQVRVRDLAGQLAAALAGSKLAELASSRLGDDLVAAGKAADPGHFRSLDAIADLTDESALVRSPELFCRVRVDGGEARIVFAGNYVSGPAAIAPALRFAAERERFRVGELPGELSVQDRIDLVSRLVSEGLLHIL
jgi:lysine-specific demethylase/histidyl-hydroxylase NO66